jgi:hypothetical protein
MGVHACPSMVRSKGSLTHDGRRRPSPNFGLRSGAPEAGNPRTDRTERHSRSGARR